MKKVLGTHPSKGKETTRSKKVSGKETAHTLYTIAKTFAIIAFIVFLFTLPKKCNQQMARTSSVPFVITQTIPAGDWVWVDFNTQRGNRRIEFYTEDNDVRLFVKGQHSGKVAEPFVKAGCVSNPADTKIALKTTKEVEIRITLY